MMTRHVTAVALLVVAATAGSAFAAGMKFKIGMSGAQEVPEIATGAGGKVTAKFDDALTRVDLRVKLDSIVDVTAVHLHCNRAGESGPVAFGLIAPGPCTLAGNSISCTLTNADLIDVTNDCEAVVGRPVNNIAALAFAMREGLIYLNVHTAAHTGGEIRGQLADK